MNHGLLAVMQKYVEEKEYNYCILNPENWIGRLETIDAINDRMRVAHEEQKT